MWLRSWASSAGASERSASLAKRCGGSWRTALIAGASGTLVGWFGADWLKALPGTTLKRFFATAIIVFGVQMWISSFEK